MVLNHLRDFLSAFLLACIELLFSMFSDSDETCNSLINHEVSWLRTDGSWGEPENINCDQESKISLIDLEGFVYGQSVSHQNFEENELRCLS